MTERTKVNIMFGVAAIMVGFAACLTVHYAMNPEVSWWDTFWFGCGRFVMAMATTGGIAMLIGIKPYE